MRAAILAMLLAVASAFPAQAEGCADFTLGTFVSEVSYFAKKMDPVQSAPGTLAFVHPDDNRIGVSFWLQAARPSAPERHSEHLAQLTDRLEAKAREFVDPQVKVEKVLFPLDPVAWILSVSSPRGDGFSTRATMDIRLGPECHLVSEWTAYEIPALAGRISEMRTAIEAVRSNAFKHVGRAEWLPERFVPAGSPALLYGLVVPLLVAFVMMVGFRAMSSFSVPGAPVRAAAAISAAAAATTFGVQLPGYLEGFPELRFVDGAALLSFAFALAAVAAATGVQRAMLAGFAAGITVSIASMAAGALGWTPWPAAAMTGGAAMFAASLLGIVWWHAGRDSFLSAGD